MKSKAYFVWGVFDERTGVMRQIYKIKSNAVYYQRQNYIHSARVEKVKVLRFGFD